jgi:hypothetical protein
MLKKLLLILVLISMYAVAEEPGKIIFYEQDLAFHPTFIGSPNQETESYS